MKYIYLLSLLLFSQYIIAQDFPIFVHNEDGWPAIQIYDDIIQTIDSGYLVLLTQLETDNNQSDSLLVPYLRKYNKDFDLMWDKKYYHWVQDDSIIVRIDLASTNNSLFQATSGNIYFTGSWWDFLTGNKKFTYVLDDQGDSLDFILASDFAFHQFYRNNEKVFFTGFDLAQEKTQFGKLLNEDLTIIDIINDNFILSHDLQISQNNEIYSVSYGGANNTRLRKYSTQGDLVFDSLYNEIEASRKLILNTEGNPVIFGEGFVIFDENFGIQVHQTAEEMEIVELTGAFVAQRGNDLKQTTDGGYIMCGEIGNTFEPNDFNNAFVIKLDAAGEWEWGEIYPFPYTYAFEIFEVEDGYVFLAGGDVTGDIWLVKVDESGMIVNEQEVIISERKSRIKIFPNPVDDYLTIELSDLGGIGEIFSLDGKLIMEFSINAT